MVVAPWWEQSKEGAELMLKYGVEYGLPHLSSFCHRSGFFHSFPFIQFRVSLVIQFSISLRFTHPSFYPKVTHLLIDLSKDHSLSHHDCLPYYLRTGDTWTPIDYTKPASHWMKPLVRGSETGLVEIPANWYLDDLPPMMFIKKAPNSHGWVNPKDVEELWKDHFDYFYREYDSFCFPVTIHPDVSGHPHVLLMLER